MDRILVINLTRMGDIIQTSPLVSGLRQRHPRAEIGLLVLKAFAGAARLVPGVDRLLELDQDQAVARLLDPDRSLAARASWFSALAAELRGEGWDLVFNLSHSRDSAVLARLLARGEVRGIVLRNDGRTVVHHDWARYFFCVTGNRAVNSFNLVDIYRLVGDLGAGEGPALALEVGPAAAARAAELLAHLPAGRRRPLVMIQPGASRENRRWPGERLAAVMRRLHEELGAAFLLCGSAGEAPLCAEVARSAVGLPLLDLAGHTSLEELAALCSRADLLITNDTGTLHVAAARGLRSVSLFFATALPRETGPWLPGCLVLQAELDCAPCSHQVVCPHVMCREQIPAEAVGGAALELLRRAGWPARPPAGWESLPGVRAFETCRDGHGLQDLRLLGRRRPGAAELAARAYRELWRSGLDRTAAGGEEIHGAETAAFDEWLADWDDPLPGTEAELAELGRDLAELGAMAARGAQLVERVEREMARPDPDPAVLAEAVAAVPELDDRIFTFELSRPLLRPLGVLFRFGKEELREEESLAELGRGTLGLYRALEGRSAALGRILAALGAALTSRVEAGREVAA